MSALGLTHGRIGDVVVVRPVGLLDVSTYPQLRDDLLKLSAEVPAALVVDLSALAVDRVTTLSVFPTVWLRISSWPDIPMALAAPGDDLARLLRTSAVHRFVPVLPTVAAALAAVAVPAARRRAVTTLPAETSSAATTRRWACERLAHWDAPVGDEAIFVVSELVTGPIGNPRCAEFTVRLELRPSGLSVAVYDDDPVRPTLAGRGPVVNELQVVDALSRAWGHGPGPGGGKVVWAVVPLPGGPQGPLPARPGSTAGPGDVSP